MADDPAKEVKPEVAQDKGPQNHERALCELFEKPFLTDFGVVNPSDKTPFRVHKAVLVSGSQYFLKILKEEWEKEQQAESAPAADKKLQSLEIPKPYPTASDETGEVKQDMVSRILKYIYHNQDLSAIKSEITEANISQMMS